MIWGCDRGGANAPYFLKGKIMNDFQKICAQLDKDQPRWEERWVPTSVDEVLNWQRQGLEVKPHLQSRAFLMVNSIINAAIAAGVVVLPPEE